MAKLTKIDAEYIAKIRPISKATKESIRKQTSKNIFVEKDGTAVCERCNGTSVLVDTKHNSTVKCPICGHKMTVWHTWRKSIYHAYSNSWRVLAKALSSTELMLQYVLVAREGRKILCIENCATEVLNFGTKKEYHYEIVKTDNKSEWQKRTYNYFREYGMGYGFRTLCCLPAKPHNNIFFREVGKIDCFKYINTKEFTNAHNDHYMRSILCHFSTKLDLVEKLQKSGLSRLVWSDLATYSAYNEIKYDSTQTELTKMLGITKRNLNMLKNSSMSLADLVRLQNNNDISDMEFEDLRGFSRYEEEDLKIASELVGVSLHKIVKYVKAQGIRATEYRNMLHKSADCGYSNKDTAYSMPKDFHKELDRLLVVEADLKKQKAEEERKLEEAKATILASIKAEVEGNKELREFFDKSKKYMCYVPGSVEDFVNEGNNNHNCVGGKHYQNAVAKKETFVFFIREANNPTASFVTCECKDGQIVQIMYDKNERVEHSSEVYQFAEAFAKRLSATQKKVA